MPRRINMLCKQREVMRKAIRLAKQLAKKEGTGIIPFILGFNAGYLPRWFIFPTSLWTDCLEESDNKEEAQLFIVKNREGTFELCTTMSAFKR